MYSAQRLRDPERALTDFPPSAGSRARLGSAPTFADEAMPVLVGGIPAYYGGRPNVAFLRRYDTLRRRAIRTSAR